MNKFKVGDKVILKNFSRDIAGEVEEGYDFYWVSKFDEYIGEELTISKVEPDGMGYRVEEFTSNLGLNEYWLETASDIPPVPEIGPMDKELFEI